MSRQCNRRRLSLQSLETRKLMAGDAFSVQGVQPTAEDDVFVDGRIITAEDYDAARLEKGTHDDVLIGGSTTWDADGTSNTLMVGEVYMGTVQDNGSGSGVINPDANDEVMARYSSTDTYDSFFDVFYDP